MSNLAHTGSQVGSEVRVLGQLRLQQAAARDAEARARHWLLLCILHGADQGNKSCTPCKLQRA